MRSNHKWSRKYKCVKKGKESDQRERATLQNWPSKRWEAFMNHRKSLNITFFVSKLTFLNCVSIKYLWWCFFAEIGTPLLKSFNHKYLIDQQFINVSFETKKIYFVYGLNFIWVLILIFKRYIFWKQNSRSIWSSAHTLNNIYNRK